MKILVTGGTGYIGSHTAVELLNSNYEIIIVDNLSNSKIEVVDKIKQITGKDFKFYQIDLRDKDKLSNIFKENKIDAVIHFAGLKAVGESVKKPLLYYRNNLDSTLTLCEVMNEYNVKKLVFSSSATVYGSQKVLPIKETASLSTTNPYGSTKLFIEYILDDIYKSDNEWSIIKLRYFNPVGAHVSGIIGEDPNGIPNNLMPYISKVATKELPYLNVFGNDYNTKDGTGVRDYIHVVDLAKGHLKALEYINNNKGSIAVNLGTGVGYSVLDIVKSYEKVNNIEIPYKIVDRREGDIEECYADPSKAYELLNWKTEKTLDDMVKSAYNYVINNK
mgnify:CR=1 FL=1